MNTIRNTAVILTDLDFRVPQHGFRMQVLKKLGNLGLIPPQNSYTLISIPLREPL